MAIRVKDKIFFGSGKNNYFSLAGGILSLVVGGTTIFAADSVGFTTPPVSQGAQIIVVDDAINNAVTDILTLKHSTSGSAAAGIGIGIAFQVEDAGNLEEQARIDAVVRVATNDAEDVDLNFKTNVNGTIKQMMAIIADETGSGGAKLVQIGTDANQVSLDIHPPTTAKGTLRITAADSAGDTVTTITMASQAAARTYTIPDAGASATFMLSGQSVKRITPVCGNAKVGATAGWVITGGTNVNSATLPAGQTNSTLVIPVSGLEIGDTVTAVAVVGQVESAGNNVTCTMDVRKLTAAAADLTDASLGTDNVGTLVADTLLNDTNGNLKVTGLTEVMAQDESLYVLLTATTAASTDIDIMSLVATVTRAG